MSTLPNVVQINVEIYVDSTLFNVVNSNVDVHNDVLTLIWRCTTSRCHINLWTTLKQGRTTLKCLLGKIYSKVIQHSTYFSASLLDHAFISKFNARFNFNVTYFSDQDAVKVCTNSLADLINSCHKELIDSVRKWLTLYLVLFIAYCHIYPIIVTRNGKIACKHIPSTKKSLWYLEFYRTVQNTEDHY